MTATDASADDLGVTASSLRLEKALPQSYSIRGLTKEEVAVAISWAGEEGWGPGCRDIEAFTVVDPEGFLGGFLDDRMVASISVIVYDSSFAFIGFYIVHKDYRGQGLGYALWKAAMQRAGSRNVGLDGVVAQQPNYSKSGFTFAYNNIRYGGVVSDLSSLDKDPTDTQIVLVNGAEANVVDAIREYDASLFPANRDSFTKTWLSTPGHVAYVARSSDGGVGGYGVIRPTHNGKYKVGPLFAQSAAVARGLLKLLLPVASEADAYVDVPEPNGEAKLIVEEFGLTQVFETARMYTSSAPQLDMQRIFGVTSFELG